MATAYEHLMQKITNARSQYKAPAIMAAIVRDGGNYAVAGVQGIRKADVSASSDSNKIKGTDKFCLGSVSKPVSGYLIAYYVQELGNAFKWETRIKDIFPELNTAAARRHFNLRDNYLNATVAQMMTHTAFFPWAPNNSMDFKLSVAELLSTINSNFQAEYANDKALMQRRYNYVISAQQDAPMAAFQYNGGPILPSAMIERLKGKTFEQLLEENVFSALGMTNAGTGRLASSATPDGVWEHSYDRSTKKAKPNTGRTLKTNNYNSHSPAGNIHFSADDAIKFMTALFPDNGKTKTVVKKPMLEAMFQHHANGCAKSGWLTGGSGNNMLITHDGDNGSSYCRMQVYPKRGEGYIVCANMSGEGDTAGTNIGQQNVGAVASAIEEMLTHWETWF